MSTTPIQVPPVSAADAGDLSTFGYGQQLRRKIGGYGSFAAGFSFVSILTTVFQLFFFGFGFGGPAFFWTWPIVLIGQLLVALCLAELAARYPISGAIYQWASRLGGRIWGWTAGWLMMVAQIVTLAGAAIALQVVLPPIWSGFQIVPGDSALTSPAGAANAVVLGVLLLCVTTAVTATGIRLMSIVNSVGVTCELVGVTLLCVALFAHAERGPGVVLHARGAPGHGYLWSFAVSGLMAAYVLVGFDSAGELSEETRDPRRTTPRTIVRAVLVSGLGGALMLLATLMAARSVNDGSLGDAGRGLPFVLTDRLGGTLGRVFLVDVAIAVSVCTLAIQTAATRMVFSMSRDGVLPFSAGLGTVNRRTGTPVRASVLVGVLAAALLLVNVGNPALFTTLASVCIMLLYLAYLMVTLPLLVRRLRGELPDQADGTKLFGLGRWGVAVNVLAIVWGVLMAINLGWPRAEVFDPAGGHIYLQWFAPLFLLGALVVGALAYAVRSRRPAVATLALDGAE